MIQEQGKLQRYFIQLSYDGAPYNGWQRQEGNTPTVQKLLEESLGRVLQRELEVIGAGRTDTGVHARCFYAHLDLACTPHTIRSKQLTYKLNRILPPEVAIHRIVPVKDHAHARFSALSRTYQYRICLDKDPFQVGRAWLFERKLDIQAMQEAANLLLAAEDFASFQKSNTQVKTTYCKVTTAHWFRQDNLLIFEIKANRFLRNMVRAIVGTLIEVGLGKTSLEEFRSVLTSLDRRKAGYSVPGQGLYLTDIEYPQDIWEEEG